MLTIRIIPRAMCNSKIIEIPMTYDGMSFVLDYYIGEASVRGVVDTGSPFITIRGGKGAKIGGFVTKKDIRPSPYEETYEVYGLQVDSSTVWCLGDLRFTTTRDRVRAIGLREMVLGVVNGSMANVGGSINGANASFVGLTKYRQDWIRSDVFRADRREFVFHRLCERNVDAFEEEFNRCGKRCERFTNG